MLQYDGLGDASDAATVDTVILFAWVCFGLLWQICRFQCDNFLFDLHLQFLSSWSQATRERKAIQSA